MTNSNHPRVLIFPMDLAAHYLRCIELSKRLHDAEIIFADSPKYRAYIEEAGYPVFEVENFDADEVIRCANEFKFDWMRPSTLDMVFDSQLEAIREYEPDAVIGDTAFTLRMAAEATGTRFVSLVNSYMTKYYRDARSVPRKHPGYKYSKMMPRRVFEGVSREIEQMSLIQIHEPFRRIRDRLGMRSTRYLLDELEGDLNLVCDLPELFPLKNQPQNYEYVGPLFYSKRENEEEAFSFLGEEAPRILVTAGSTGNGEYFRVLEDPIFEGYRILATGGASRFLHGSNVYSKAFLNHCAVLPRIDVVICHGGNGTIYQALSFGVPVICFPSNFEQEWNSSQIKKMGYGEHADDDLTPSGLKEMIGLWMEKKGSQLFSEAKKSIEFYSKKPIKIF